MSFDILTLFISLFNLALIGAIGYIFIKLISRALRGKSFSKKLLSLSILLYTIILFASLMVFYTIPPNRLSKRIDYNHYQREIGKAPLEIMELEQLSKLYKNADIIKKSTEYLPLKDHVINIPPSFNQRILATTVPSAKNTDKIKLEWYVSRNIYNGVDITDFVKPPSLDITDNQLNIIGEYTTKLDFYEYSRDLTQSQFLDEPSLLRNEHHYGVKFLVITLPDNIVLNDPAKHVTMLK